MWVLCQWLRLVIFLIITELRAGAKYEQRNLIVAKTDDLLSTVTDTMDQESKSTYKINLDNVFIPSEEWQTIEPGQTVLPGLHYRINMETGKKEAKLLDGDDGSDYLDHLARLHAKSNNMGVEKIKNDPLPLELSNANKNTKIYNFNEMDPDNLKMHSKEELSASRLRKEIIETLKNIKSEDGKTPEELSLEASETKKKYRSYKELKEDFKNLNLTLETDSEIMSRLIGKFTSSGNDNDKITILEDLEYLVHQYDNALNFVAMGGFYHIVSPGLNSTNPVVKKFSLNLLGSAVQSNPKAQASALQEGFMHHLLRIVSVDSLDGEEGVSRKALYALSCMVRGFPYGQQVLVQGGGLDILLKVFNRQDWTSLPLQIKVVTLVHDLLVERKQAAKQIFDKSHHFDIAEILARGGWCSAVSSLLAAASYDRRDRRYDMAAALKNEIPLRPDHDTIEKVLSTMETLLNVCRYEFDDTLPLLRHLAFTYDDLAYKEQFQDDADNKDAPGLFRGLADLIHSLVRYVSNKDEL